MTISEIGKGSSYWISRVTSRRRRGGSSLDRPRHYGTVGVILRSGEEGGGSRAGNIPTTDGDNSPLPSNTSQEFGQGVDWAFQVAEYHLNFLRSLGTFRFLSQIGEEARYT